MIGSTSKVHRNFSGLYPHSSPNLHISPIQLQIPSLKRRIHINPHIYLNSNQGKYSHYTPLFSMNEINNDHSIPPF